MVHLGDTLEMGIHNCCSPWEAQVRGLENLACLLPFVGLVFGACQSKDNAQPNVVDSGHPGVSESCEAGESGETTQVEAVRLNASVTWTLTFDEDAESLGFEDCAYTRSYEGVQVLNLDFDCPECDVVTKGTATMVDGDDCHAQISSNTGDRVELWGVAVGSDAGTGTLYRATYDQFPMGELTEFSLVEDGETASVAWESENELTEGGVLTLSALGSLSMETDSTTLLDDPYGPRASAYACGWPCNDPGDLEMDHDLAIGSVLPNVRLDDQCGEAVELWDFYGKYLVIDSSQSDCGPCRSMAAGASEFVSEMSALGIEVQVVTLMGNGLGDPFGTPEPETISAWVEQYALDEPVLADRGYAYALFPDFIEQANGDSWGYPAWIVVGPDMKLIWGNVGFATWADMVEIIAIDQGSR